MRFFNEAMEAKLWGRGKPYGREEFDKWLGQFDVRLVLATHHYMDWCLNVSDDF
jgi:hypothetical protein